MYVQLRIKIVQQHVSATRVTFIRVFYKNSTVGIQLIVQKAYNYRHHLMLRLILYSEFRGHKISCYTLILLLTFRRRIKSRLPFAGIIRRLTYSTRFQDKG